MTDLEVNHLYPSMSSNVSGAVSLFYQWTSPVRGKRRKWMNATREIIWRPRTLLTVAIRNWGSSHSQHGHRAHQGPPSLSSAQNDRAFLSDTSRPGEFSIWVSFHLTWNDFGLYEWAICLLPTFDVSAWAALGSHGPTHLSLLSSHLTPLLGRLKDRTNMRRRTQEGELSKASKQKATALSKDHKPTTKSAEETASWIGKKIQTSKYILFHLLKQHP